jgi:myo-inositol-1(or 4)-monophosphatase
MRSAPEQELLDLAARAARQAGELLEGRFRRPAQDVSAKSSPTDVVSKADRDSEALLIELISAERPQDGVLGEEGGAGESLSGYRWVIDPLDGTVNFLFGIPVWCVSIAVEDAAGTVAGVVHDPNRKETFTAVRGLGARLNDEPIEVSGQHDLPQALIGTGFSYEAEARAAQAEALVHVLPRVRDIRRGGSAALDLCWLACGRFDGFYEAVMELWDNAAGALIVTEAGGIVSELPAPVGSSHGVVAAGPRLHDELRALLH